MLRTSVSISSADLIPEAKFWDEMDGSDSNFLFECLVQTDKSEKSCWPGCFELCEVAALPLSQALGMASLFASTCDSAFVIIVFTDDLLMDAMETTFLSPKIVKIRTEADVIKPSASHLKCFEIQA